MVSRLKRLPTNRFNPLPAIRPGDTTPVFFGIRISKVSIHSRRLGREILADWTFNVKAVEFQSTPGD